MSPYIKMPPAGDRPEMKFVPPVTGAAACRSSTPGRVPIRNRRAPRQGNISTYVERREVTYRRVLAEGRGRAVLFAELMLVAALNQWLSPIA